MDFWVVEHVVTKNGLGRGGGGQVVSVLAFYSDDLSSNPGEAYSFFCLIKKEITKLNSI